MTRDPSLVNLLYKLQLLEETAERLHAAAYRLNHPGAVVPKARIEPYGGNVVELGYVQARRGNGADRVTATVIPFPKNRPVGQKAEEL